MTRKYWRTGEYVWAVELMGTTVVRWAGPIRPDDADPALLEHFTYTTFDIEWMRTRKFHPGAPTVPRDGCAEAERCFSSFRNSKERR